MVSNLLSVVEETGVNVNIKYFLAKVSFRKYLKEDVYLPETTNIYCFANYYHAWLVIQNGTIFNLYSLRGIIRLP